MFISPNSESPDLLDSVQVASTVNTSARIPLRPLWRRDHPIQSLKLISTHFTLEDWRIWIIVKMSVHFHFERKKVYNLERIRRQKVDRSHRPQPLHPSGVLISLAIPTNGQSLATYLKAYVRLFQPLPLVLGWTSMIAAYSGSQARSRSRFEASEKQNDTKELTFQLSSSNCSSSNSLSSLLKAECCMVSN